MEDKCYVALKAMKLCDSAGYSFERIFKKSNFDRFGVMYLFNSNIDVKCYYVQPYLLNSLRHCPESMIADVSEIVSFKELICACPISNKDTP